MNARAVLISLAISVVLAIGAIAVLLPEIRDKPEESAALALRPSEVSRLEVRAGDSFRRLTRDGERWILAWSDAGHAERAWIADASRVRGAVRLLIDGLRVDSSARTFEGGGAVAVTIGGESGDWRVEFGEASLGGEVLVRVREPGGREIAARCDATLRDVFTAGGLLAWRERGAFAGVRGAATSVYLRSGVGPLRLSRVGGRWAMSEPISAPADGDRCRGLLGVLGGLEVVSFEDGVTAESEIAGLGQAGAIVVVEEEFSGQDGARRLVSGMAVGSPANAESSELYVLIEQREIARDGSERVVLGPVVARVRVDAINQIAPQATAYLDRRTLEASRADVRRLDIVGGSRGDTYLRSIAGWSDTGERAVGGSAAAHLDAMLALLTSLPAARVELSRPTGWRTIGEVEARGNDGASLGRVALAVVEVEGRSAALATERAGVVRLFAIEPHLELVAWLERP